MRFEVGLKINQEDSDYACYNVSAPSAFSAAVIAIYLYLNQANYKVYEIVVRRLYD